MIRFRNSVVFVLLTITSWVQSDTTTKYNDPAHTQYLDSTRNPPKGILELFEEVKPYAHLLTAPVDNDNETRRCCGKYGCFTSEPVFGCSYCLKQIVLPFCQDKLQVKFYLWTSKNRENYDTIDPEDKETLIRSNMIANSTVVIYINGFLGTGKMPYIQKIKDAMLKRKPDVMFISVEWVNGARMEHVRALANAHMVGAVTARLVDQLEKYYQIRPKNIHIIGINLGAISAGAVGKRIPGIGRITGLDPVGWNMHNCPKLLGLSSTDAEFVDVIHTNAITYGMAEPSGHLDIYINGALEQPACRGFPGCNHTISIFYFLETIEKDLPYLAFQCSSYDNFLRGMCSKGCGKNNSLCASMGYYSDHWKSNSRESPTLMYMSMGTDENHYHLYHYYVKIDCEDDTYRLWKYGRNWDKVQIKLIGNESDTGFQTICQEIIAFTAESYIKQVITSKNQIGLITGIVLKWIPEANKTIPPSCPSSDAGNVTTVCQQCPFKLKSIEAKNLETGMGNRFTEINKQLPPNEEVLIGCLE